MLDFSIIVPVYNSAATLQKCLDSILNQTFENYEVILINDGSTDASWNICQQYKSKDERFIILNQENSGPSQARNCGLEIANGDWICFVDSDDWISKEYLSSLREIIISEDPDVIFLGHTIFDNEGNKIKQKIPICKNREKYKMLLELSDEDMFGYTWIKAFKRNAIGTFRFEQGVNLFEDEIFACQVLANCDHISLLQKAIYNYCIGNAQTLSGKTYSDYCAKCERVYLAWKSLLKPYENYAEVMCQKANAFVSRCYYYGFERNIGITNFFSDLAATSFFEEHLPITKLDRYVQKRCYIMLWLKKMKYLIKVRISKIMKMR